MNESPENIDSELAPMMEYFGERLNRVFAYFFCKFEFKDDEDLRADPTQNDRAWSLHTIENACLHETLIALRDLDDFLSVRTPHTKTDDIRAGDFGFMGSHCFLSKSERERINKLVAHTTTTGAANQGFHWDVLEFATKGISQCREFLKWVESEYGLTHFYLYTAALAIRTKTEAQFAFISREAEKRRAKIR